MSDEHVRDDSEQTTDVAEVTIGRRGLLKTLVSIPVLGIFILNFLKKKAADDLRKREILAELGVTEGGPAVIPDAISRPPGDRVRLGIIGFGGEGEAIVREAGFAHTDWVEGRRIANQENPRFLNYDVVPKAKAETIVNKIRGI